MSRNVEEENISIYKKKPPSNFDQFLTYYQKRHLVVKGLVADIIY